MTISMSNFYKLELGNIILTNSCRYKVVGVNDSDVVLIKYTDICTNCDCALTDNTFSLLTEESVTAKGFELYILPRVIKFPLDIIINNIKLLKVGNIINISAFKVPCALYNGHKFYDINANDGSILDPMPTIEDINCQFKLDQIIKSKYGVYFCFKAENTPSQQPLTNNLLLGDFSCMHKVTHIGIHCAGYIDDQDKFKALDLKLYIDLNDFSKEDESNE